MKKYLKKIPQSVFLIALCTILICLTGYLIKVRVEAKSAGGMLGQSIGGYSGRAIGSLEGMTVGQVEGSRAGIEVGLSAEDTTVELAGKIQEVEKLQVLVASGTFSDVLSVGSDYAVLLSMKYNAIFTVDLTSAEIALEKNKLYILIDQPQLEFSPMGEIEKKNEYQKNGSTGSAEKGYIAFNNAASQMELKAKEKLENDEYMMKAARTSAEKQLVQLVNAVSVSNSKLQIIVEFRDTEEDGQ